MKIKKMAEQYLQEINENVQECEQAPDEMESKRESLAILASLGSTKDFIGVEMSLGDIKKLKNKDVKKYYNRYQTVLGKQISSSLVDSAFLVASKAASMIVSIDDTEQLYQDLKSDEIIKRELTSFAGLLILKGGRLVALASAFFQVAKHIQIGKSQQIQEENQEETSVPKQLPKSLQAKCKQDVSKLLADS